MATDTDTETGTETGNANMLDFEIEYGLDLYATNLNANILCYFRFGWCWLVGVVGLVWLVGWLAGWLVGYLACYYY